MANSFQEIRRNPPLFEHRGERSTLPRFEKYHESPINWTRKINQEYDIIKVEQIYYSY